VKNPWKCPSCTYISTRNWNIKSHINRKHSGYGRPLPLLGRKTTIIGHNQTKNFTPYSDGSVKNLYFNEDSIFRSLIDQKDQREILLYDILEQISPQFREIEQLLISVKSDYGTMQFILASAVISAVSSYSPTESINDSLKICYLFSTSTKMINCAAYVLNSTPAFAKEILKRFLPNSNGQ
jgi:hypothetical protein